MNKKTLQLIFLNVGIAVANIIAFSDAAVGIDLDASLGSTLERAAGYTLIIMSVIGFFMGNYKILFEKEEKTISASGYVLEEIDTPKECLDALMLSKKPAFIQDISTAMDQVRRLERKILTLREILFQKCQAQGGEFLGFQSVVDDSEKMVYENVKRMLSRMSIFDQEEYDAVMKRRNGSISVEAWQAKQQIFAEHFAYVKQQIEKSEAILLELDRLLTEISKIGDQDVADEETMAGIRDVIAGMKKLRSNEDESMEQLEKKYQ